MPGYVSNVLSKFQHDAPKHPQHIPSRYVTPIYGDKNQYDTRDETPPLTAKQYLTIQKVTGSVLYYARAVDPTVLMPLNDIATEQTKATEKTQAATNQMLDYLATHPDATIRYHASDMVLHIHSDASYLSVSNARSRLGGLFFLGNKSPEQDTLNGSVLNVAAVIKNVVALINYYHSRNPRARPHGRRDKSKRPESHPTKERARACVRCLNTEPNYYYCPITLVLS
jgi:hypothetical protein